MLHVIGARPKQTPDEGATPMTVPLENVSFNTTLCAGNGPRFVTVAVKMVLKPVPTAGGALTIVTRMLAVNAPHAPGMTRMLSQHPLVCSWLVMIRSVRP